jgi:hypothetical protein
VIFRPQVLKFLFFSGNFYSPKPVHNNTTASDIFQQQHNLSTRTTYEYGLYSSPNTTSSSTNNLFGERKYYPPPPYPGQIKPQLHNDNEDSLDHSQQPTSNPIRSTFIRSCTPQAFKFFMEQHMENIFKHRKAREYRHMQLERELSKADIPSELKDQMYKLLCQKETNYLRLRRAKMNKSMFETVKLLGIGAFGEGMFRIWTFLVNLIEAFNAFFDFCTFFESIWCAN